MRLSQRVDPVCRLSWFPRLKQVPGRLRVRLQGILDTEEAIKKSVILSFSLCGNFLLAYRHEAWGQERTRYFLEW